MWIETAAFTCRLSVCFWVFRGLICYLNAKRERPGMPAYGNQACAADSHTAGQCPGNRPGVSPRTTGRGERLAVRRSADSIRQRRSRNRERRVHLQGQRRLRVVTGPVGHLHREGERSGGRGRPGQRTGGTQRHVGRQSACGDRPDERAGSASGGKRLVIGHVLHGGRQARRRDNQGSIHLKCQRLRRSNRTSPWPER